MNASMQCRCKRTGCLKMYCQCFANGQVCAPHRCTCTGDCANTLVSEGAAARDHPARARAMRDMVERHGPDVFRKRERVMRAGCHCDKQPCSKNYCICFRHGVACGAQCRCTDCENVSGAACPVERARKTKRPRLAVAALLTAAASIRDDAPTS